MQIRLVREDDGPALAELYAESVRFMAPGLYTTEQIEAWAAFPEDTEKFHGFIFENETWLIEDYGDIKCFCGLGADGHIASLYTAGRSGRRGYAGRLLHHVLERGRERGLLYFYTEASFLSRALFEKHGFTVEEEENVQFGDVDFDRFKMELRIDY